MKQKLGITGLVLLGIMVVIFANQAVLASVHREEEHKIVITAMTGTQYDKKAIKLQKNTLYEITFWNNETGVWHDLIIAMDGRRIANYEAMYPKNGDIVLGPLPVEASANNAGGTGTSVWTGNFTTPDSNGYIRFFCSYAGHFDAGMRGYFKIGEPAGELSPEFDFKFQLLNDSAAWLSDYEGNPIILDFFSMNCQDCLTQFSYYREAQNVYPYVQIVSISIDPYQDSSDYNDYLSNISQFVSDYQMTWTVGHIFGYTQGLPFHPITAPTIVFIDSNGETFHEAHEVTPYPILAEWIERGDSGTSNATASLPSQVISPGWTFPLLPLIVLIPLFDRWLNRNKVI
ncbi:MAG: hypothetical protein ACFFFG_10500 [Candidatus Thorarchaeota archaeon]